MSMLAGGAQLPEGWAAYQDTEGRTYYANAATGESSYEAPAIPVSAQAPALPDGWSAYTDAEGRTYYANVATGETSWEPPASSPPVSAVPPPGSAPAGGAGGQWTLEQAYELGKEGEEHIFEGKVPVLDRIHGSVAATVEALESGSLPMAEGYCVVFSKSKQHYYLLWRGDKEDEAFDKLGLGGQQPEEPWSTRQVIGLGPLGSEPAWEQRAGLLDKAAYSSVSDAVAALNSGLVQVDIGYCAVFSESQQYYYLLYRADKSAEAETFTQM